MTNNKTTALIDAASEAVFQRFKYVKPRLNRAAIRLICLAYEEEKALAAFERPDECAICGGRGWFSDTHYYTGDEVQVQCETCLGTGKIPEQESTQPAVREMSIDECMKELEIVYDNEIDSFGGKQYCAPSASKAMAIALAKLGTIRVVEG